MILSDQVCSLEYAKKLKELGVNQESLFWWYQHNKKKYPTDWCIMYSSYDSIPDRYSAFTPAELLQLLPNRITLTEGEPYNSFQLRIEKGIWIKDMDDPNKLHQSEMYMVNYYCDSTSQEINWMFSSMTKNMTDENPANALAMMLIYLLEQGLIKNDTKTCVVQK
jgi:hypothetical protein